jgi:site-specific recombinase XerD
MIQEEDTMTLLRQQMIADMSVRGLAEATRKSYLHAVSQLALFHGRRPDELGIREVQAFLVHLVEDRNLSYGTCNGYVYGLRFFYSVTLGRDDLRFQIPTSRQPSRLPSILSRTEVRALLEAAVNIRDRALLTTTYGAGLRVSEVIKLKVSDIDATRMSIRIEQGKRKKDRYGPVNKGHATGAAQLLACLQTTNLAVPRGQITTATIASNSASHIPCCQGEGRNQKAGRYTFTTPCLCHPSTGKRL